MASFAIILIVCGALCSIGGMHFPPVEALVTHEESSPFPPLPPTRRCGPPEFVNRDSRPPIEPRLQDWEPGTPPRKPPKRTPTKPGLGTVEEPAVLDSNPIPVPDTPVAEELPNSVVPHPLKPGLQDLRPIPVPITGEEPSAYP